MGFRHDHDHTPNGNNHCNGSSHDDPFVQEIQPERARVIVFSSMYQPGNDHRQSSPLTNGTPSKVHRPSALCGLAEIMKDKGNVIDTNNTAVTNESSNRLGRQSAAAVVINAKVKKGGRWFWLWLISFGLALLHMVAMLNSSIGIRDNNINNSNSNNNVINDSNDEKDVASVSWSTHLSASSSLPIRRASTGQDTDHAQQADTNDGASMPPYIIPQENNNINYDDNDSNQGQSLGHDPNLDFGDDTGSHVLQRSDNSRIPILWQSENEAIRVAAMDHINATDTAVMEEEIFDAVATTLEDRIFQINNDRIEQELDTPQHFDSLDFISEVNILPGMDDDAEEEDRFTYQLDRTVHRRKYLTDFTEPPKNKGLDGNWNDADLDDDWDHNWNSRDDNNIDKDQDNDGQENDNGEEDVVITIGDDTPVDNESESEDVDAADNRELEMDIIVKQHDDNITDYQNDEDIAHPGMSNSETNSSNYDWVASKGDDTTNDIHNRISDDGSERLWHQTSKAVPGHPKTTQLPTVTVGSSHNSSNGGLNSYNYVDSKVKIVYSPPSKEHQFAACVLWMDDNYLLPEWLAYHFHVANLRHVIVAVDPKSKTSPYPILDRWRSGMNMSVTVWSNDFANSDEQQRGMQKAYRILSSTPRPGVVELVAKQVIFYRKCLQRFKNRGLRWAMVWDVDEFARLQYKPQTEAAKAEMAGVVIPPISQPGSVVTFLENEMKRRGSVPERFAPCIPLPRSFYGPAESTYDELRNGLDPVTLQALQGDAASNISVSLSKFTTLRFRKHAPANNTINGNVFSKSLLHLHKVAWQHLEVMGDPHRPVRKYCPSTANLLKPADTVLVLNHYWGSMEQYNYRVDERRQDKEFLRESLRGADEEENDEIRSWINGFVAVHGPEKAAYLLEGTGFLDGNVTRIEPMVRTTAKRVRTGSITTWKAPSLASQQFNSPTVRESGSVGAKLRIVAVRNSSLVPQPGPHQMIHVQSQLPRNKQFCGCLWWIDNNDLLSEWLAYHYHVANLRNLYVAVDPDSRTTPYHILDRWRSVGMNIAVLGNEFQDEDEKRRAMDLARNRIKGGRPGMLELVAKQTVFYNRCLKRHKKRGLRWAMVTDVNEFVRINVDAARAYGVSIPPISNAGSVVTTFAVELNRKGSVSANFVPCVPMPQVSFDPFESTSQNIIEPINRETSHVVKSFNVSQFATMRFRSHFAYNISTNGKTLSKFVMDLDKIDWRYLRDLGTPYRPFPRFCSVHSNKISVDKCVLVLNHYFPNRTDEWRSKEFMQASVLGVDEFENDDIRPWLNGFVDLHGAQQAEYLLQGTGILDESRHAMAR